MSGFQQESVNCCRCIAWGFPNDAVILPCYMILLEILSFRKALIGHCNVRGQNSHFFYVYFWGALKFLRRAKESEIGGQASAIIDH